MTRDYDSFTLNAFAHTFVVWTFASLIRYVHGKWHVLIISSVMRCWRVTCVTYLIHIECFIRYWRVTSHDWHQSSAIDTSCTGWRRHIGFLKFQVNLAKEPCNYWLKFSRCTHTSRDFDLLYFWIVVLQHSGHKRWNSVLFGAHLVCTFVYPSIVVCNCIHLFGI